MTKHKRSSLLKLLPNRVRCNYQGGAGIDRLQGRRNSVDSDQPEEWVASLTGAKNPELSPVKDEGYSLCQLEENSPPVTLLSILEEEPLFYLGPERYGNCGIDLGFILKILDPSLRLPVHAHPTAEFAQKQLGSRYGALECYYILAVHPDTKPSIRLGFQHAPSQQQWKEIIEKQNIPAMDACFEPIPVAAGEVWYVSGGMPHAIGENILTLEIKEPSDLAVYCEFEREGIVAPPKARFMGKGLDFCLDIFHYEEKTVEAVTRDHRLSPVLLEFGAHFQLEQLVGPEITSSFRVQRLILEGNVERLVLPGGTPQVALVIKGVVRFSVKDDEAEVKPGESLFIAGGVNYVEVYALFPAEICFVMPG
jgi:mannose-6-phosphate isomerase